MYLINNQAILPHFVALVKKEKIIGFPLKGKKDEILKAISEILEKNKIKPKGIKGLITLSDLSSFTQVRISVTIANLMGKFFNIPISFLELGEIKDKNFKETIEIAQKKLKRKIILPIYDKKPNITIGTQH